ncbi:aldehyde dehydrogenase family protein [Rhodococcus sp. P1Y]|uniref:aldehyde dehydrogenase family protein n=1 Tax=Rhodococcus sp. P1Y TaxID=1302308 RepID=UPI000EAE9F3E|nr:aldehyde dehydrogenase family protein [Rhodococcus sp. P1Y]AYJ50351.1 aldehyde dehydrogenase family protein [Rhodococcus sp. P1Y]
MREYRKFYIGGQWVEPAGSATMDIVNPATEEVCGIVAMGSDADVDRAVAAARGALPGWAATPVAGRADVLRAILSEFEKRTADLAEALTEEMGAPKALASGFQVNLGAGHLNTAIEALENYRFEEQRGASLIVQEPIGVCGLITPWNWPISLIAVKVFPALATGCTMVLKPSERSPFSGQIFAEILDSAGVPDGVFNLVQGDGPGVGAALSGHPDIDMISFTGSTRAGVDVAARAAHSVKRVTQELGGKGPNIILDDDDFAANVGKGVASMMMNSGQTCSAPSRMLVPHSRMAEAAEIAREATAHVTVGDPNGDFAIGPVVAKSQFDSIQTLLQQGIDEGATLVAGGPGRPDGLEKGYYVKPTVFADVKNDMTIGRTEIFGPVLTIIGYDNIDNAVEIANDTDYGLAAFIAGADVEQARSVARRIQAGSVVINDAFDFSAPFGGYKKSGNGREWGDFGFLDYLEVKSVLGYGEGDS